MWEIASSKWPKKLGWHLGSKLMVWRAAILTQGLLMYSLSFPSWTKGEAQWVHQQAKTENHWNWTRVKHRTENPFIKTEKLKIVQTELTTNIEPRLHPLKLEIIETELVWNIEPRLHSLKLRNWKSLNWETEKLNETWSLCHMDLIANWP